ncbi:MAG: chemotaxis protein CheX [Myxococcales bacterium]|nr:chemotaxis protein CheX [Myxococcales bacterium]
MNVEFVNPFLSAILNVLSTMAMTEAKAGKPFIKSSNMASGEVTGMIGLAGNQVRGSLAINFSREAILHIASQMLGESFTEIDDTVKDVVGEITNMVTGGAKKSLAEQGYRFEMAIPTTITGKSHTITHKTHGPIIVVPFTIDGTGEFYVEVCFEDV